jgi:hypothetical protein
MTEQEYNELKMDMEQEMKEEAYEQSRMRTDLDYAVEKLGLYDIHDEINKFVHKLEEYGHDISFNQVIEMLKDI